MVPGQNNWRPYKWAFTQSGPLHKAGLGTEIDK